MTCQPPAIPVVAALGITPDAETVRIELPEGLALDEIVRLSLPEATEEQYSQCRVALVTPDGVSVFPIESWRLVRPKPGVEVVIRLTPAKSSLRTVLSIVVAIAAVATGAYFAGTVLELTAGTAGYAAAAGAVAGGANLVGSLLLNALIPPPKTSKDKDANSYSISGWKNKIDPDGAIPMVMGRLRYAPPFAAYPYTEIVGDRQFVRAIFNFGEGPLSISEIHIGDTALSEFDDVETEIRYGYEEDAPLSLYPRQVVEETIGVELTRPLPRDDLGEVIDGPAEETPVVRTCGRDATGASIILSWPAGLVRFNDSGKKRSRTVSILVEQRLADAVDWQEVTTLEITAKKTEGFFRQHSWEFPSRGRWQVRLTRLTDESDDNQVQDRTAWAALQTLRPEYPIAYSKPLALLAMRIRATHQINGALDNISAIVERVCPDWDGATQQWVEQASSNPASLYRMALQHPANQKPQLDSQIDLEQLQDWHEFCDAHGLRYCRVLEQTDNNLRDALTEIAAAGRASPRHDGTKWGVVIDRPGDIVVDHIHPRNSWGFSMTRAYVTPPDGFVVSFQDGSGDYETVKRIVPWPGFVGEPELLETLDLPGNTEPDSIYREATRRALEIEHRPDSYQVTQDGSVRVATRGDTVRVSYDVLDRVLVAARVIEVMDALIEIDEMVTMEAGKTYGIRFRKFADPEPGAEPDTIGVSVTRTVKPADGARRVLTLEGSGDVPAEGDLILFGETGSESFSAVVKAVEATEDMCSILHLIDAAPEIDEALDALVIPAWSGRVGAEIDENVLQPSAPRWASVRSGIDGTGEADRIDYLVEAGSGAIVSAEFEIDHRLQGAPSWTTDRIAAANGGGTLLAYGSGDAVEMRARAVSPTSIAGPYGPVVAFVVGAGDVGIPGQLEDASITVSGGLGHALISVSVADSLVAKIRFYRVPAGDTLDRETHAIGAPLTVTAGSTVSYTDGDGTRVNMLANGAFDDSSAWTLDPGWSISGGVATHTAGAAEAISQSQNLVAGKVYRVAVDVIGRTAGNITPRLVGGSTVSGDIVNDNGRARQTLTAVTGNETFDLFSKDTFDGSLDDVVLFEETSSCVPAGSYDYYVEPWNADDLAGPVSGPFPAHLD